MRLNPTGEVPVLVHNDNVICDPTQIMDYLENSFNDEGTPKLVPEEGSTYYHRVSHYRELLDSLQMDAYTHGSILHPEITVDSHIPAYAATCIRKEGSQSWLCGEFFSMADVSLAVTLHRLKFLGLSRRYWGNGNRVNLETYYERVVQRPAFRRVLGHVNNILISAVLPVAFRVARKNAPVIFGSTLLISILGGVTYFAFLYMKKRLTLFS
ncbi:ganglioside-induced differentiation-associated protein 1 isoform X4 [Echeneis naucrates]|uniref:ganglioside-induced differentiation-associated protein 1 isoform X4 n=1 Tax=Echeneis naucrates TaxID=173247 RepID=UPI001113775B|nr:ganglioside-induced differentiation-associated protein 1 isoform X4 [Echeneis naucrates]